MQISTKFFFIADERNFLSEEDDVMQGRIVSLMELLANSGSEDVSQMVINFLVSYKNLLISEIQFQNKVTSRTLESLIKALLITSCRRKDFRHLNSMVKFKSSKFVPDLTHFF